MKGHQIINLFFLMVVVILIALFVDVETIKYAFGVVFLWTITGILFLAAIMPLWNKKDDDND